MQLSNKVKLHICYLFWVKCVKLVIRDKKSVNWLFK